MSYDTDFPPFVAGSETSYQASAKLAPKWGTKKRIVWEAIRDSGDDGMTDEEIEILYEMLHQTVSSARRCLVLEGLVVPSGGESHPITRTNETGAEAQVWVAALNVEERPA